MPLLPNDVYEAALDCFTEDLNVAHRTAGSPTYSQLQQVSERLRARGGADRVDVLSRSNTHEILHGRRPQPPKWSWVRSYISVLRTIAANNEISPDNIGPTAEWKRKYDAVRAAADQAARRPANVGRHRKQLQQTESLKWWQWGGNIALGSLNLYTYLESRAKVVRTYGPQIIPGLLQIEAYARVNLARYCVDASVNEITRLAELYRRRQERLDQLDFQLWAVIDEIALRSQQVSAQVMRCQITHLINVAEQPNVTLQVVNSAKLAGLNDHVLIKEPITHFRFPEEHLDDVVFIERPPDSIMLTDRKETAHYSQLMSLLGIRATRAGNAQDHLRRIFMDL